MSPEGLAAASRRIESMLVDRREAFAREANEKTGDFGARGALHSSMHALAIYGVAAKELDTRAQLAWNIIRSVVDSEGWNPNEEYLKQVETELNEVLDAGSRDVEGRYKQATNLINGNWPTLEEPLANARKKALADAEIDQLSRKRRYVPLLDGLGVPRYAAAHTHWKKAVDLASSTPPDYPNAIKEAVSAVESLAQIVLGKSGLTLGDSVKELRAKKRIPAGSDKVLDGLWAFANQGVGTRHAGTTPPTAQDSDWAFASQVAEGGLRLLLSLDT